LKSNYKQFYLLVNNMKQLIGVRGLHTLLIEDLKKDLLFFDKLYIIGLKDFKYEVQKEYPYKKVRTYKDLVIFSFYHNLYEKIKHGGLPEYLEYLNKELDYLIENDKIIMDAPTYLELQDEKIEECRQISHALSDSILHYSKSKSESQQLYSNTEFSSEKMQDIANFFARRKQPIVFDNDLIVYAHNLAIREESIYFNYTNHFNSTPIIQKFNEFEGYETKKQKIINIFYNKIPLPSDQCPWEEIFNFKNDETSIGFLKGLKHFINCLSNDIRPINEIEDELEWRLFKYEEALRLHRLKTENSTLKIILMIGAEILENLPRLRFSKIIQSFYKLKENKIELLEAELKTEGSELAYISRAKKRFIK